MKTDVIEDESSFEGLQAGLRHHSPLRRKRAAARLAQFGAPAVEPLCAALKDADRSVRDAAARSLGEIGDARAIDALVDALHDTFAWRRPWFQWIVGIGLIGFAVVGELIVWLLIALILILGIALTLVCLRNLELDFLGGLWEISFKAIAAVRSWFNIGDFFNFRKRRNAYCLAIAEALMKIAERSPSPQLRDALPDLGAVAGDFVQQDSRTRDTARAVAERIQSLTEKLKNLPAPAHAPEADVSALPRTATVPVIDEQTLPRAVDVRSGENP